ncbi:MAG: hypothetical protein WA118_02635 [Carboxydocellales bacterium]
MADIYEGKVSRQRQQNLELVKKLPPGPKALEKLAFVRKEYDLAITGYMNSLKILSDTTYQDRKHFLNELIQNADDAQFASSEAMLTFLIHKECLEIMYNEQGFTVDDVIAITDVGESTKIKKNNSSKRYIGEKGIGFKSVFALASHVEIESPPWHFILRKHTCIVPEVIKQGSMKPNSGTRLSIHFSDKDSIDIIAAELHKFVTGQLETLLFLQHISKLRVIDMRKGRKDEFSLTLEPAARNSQLISLRTFPTDELREYVLYEEDLKFPSDLVSFRWEDLGASKGTLNRKMVVAGLVDFTEEFMPEGRLFCFLPTNVKLPVPLFLQIDGITKADRESLYDPEHNKWNRHLLDNIPGFLMRAILAWRDHPSMYNRIPDFIPVQKDSGQLAEAFQRFVGLLRESAWVRSFEDKEWVKPEDALIANPFWTGWFQKYPSSRKNAEKVLGKKFVHLEWANNLNWRAHWREYKVPHINDRQVALMLEKIELPEEMLKRDDNLIGLYKYLLTLTAINDNRSNQHANVMHALVRAPIFPLEGGVFGPLETEQSSGKIFWLLTRSKRSTGLGKALDYRVIDPEYTHRPELGGDASQARIAESRRVHNRNETVRELLRKLGVQELTEDTLLRELQLPWLLDGNRVNDPKPETRYKVLKAIFDAYRAKRIPEGSYLADLYRIKDAVFFSEKKNQKKLGDLLLPGQLRLMIEDTLYADSGLEALELTKSLLEPPPSEAKQIKRERENERRRKHYEEVRTFLIRCGIRSAPTFELDTTKHGSSLGFERNDSKRFDIWSANLKEGGMVSTAVEVITVQIDDISRTILTIQPGCSHAMSKALYGAWEKTSMDPPPGLFKANKIGGKQSKTVTLQDHFWCGVERSQIKLEPVNGGLVSATDALRITGTELVRFENAKVVFPFVLEDNGGEAGYTTGYLDSLQVRKPGITDVNRLWGILDRKAHPEIIKIAVEFVRAGMSPSYLRVFDLVENRLRPVQEFRLGHYANQGEPLIEEQYGEPGRILGELIGLSSEFEIGFYLKGIKELFQKSTFFSSSKNDLHGLLNNWYSWSATDRGTITREVKKVFDELKLLAPPVIIFNNPKTFDQLDKAGIVVVGLKIEESDRFAFEKAANELGLILPYDSGELGLRGERPLDEEESSRFKLLLEGYLKLLDEKEVSKLKLKLTRFGKLDTVSGRVVKVSYAQRSLGTEKKIAINIELPHLDNRSGKLLVSLEEGSEEILAHLLSLCDFTRFKDALGDLKELRVYRASPAVPTTPIRSMTPQTKEVNVQRFGENASDVAREVINSLKDDRIAPEREIIREWNNGLSPEEEIESGMALRKQIISSFQIGPEIREKKNRTPKPNLNKIALGPNQKLFDPWRADPKSFLLQEYGGKCQICATELRLSSGKKWFEVFHIREDRGEISWADRPYNILCLCPNCHALAKHGGELDLHNIYILSGNLRQGMALPEEFAAYSGDYYCTEIQVNGVEKQLVISKVHLNYFAQLFSFLEVAASAEEY